MPCFEVIRGKDDDTVKGIKGAGHGKEDMPMLLLRTFTTFSRPGQEVPIKYVYLALGRLRSVLHECETYNRTFEDSAESASLPICRAMMIDTLSSLGLPSGKPVSTEDLRSLIAVVEEVYAEEIVAAKERLARGTLFYEDLAELYQPGTECVGPAAGLADGMGFIVRCCHFDEEKSLFGPKLNCKLELEFVASVGDRFAVVRCQEQLGPWQGLRSVGSLIYQVLQHEQRSRLEKRGGQYASMASGVHFMHCRKGMFFSPQLRGTSDAGRVMVDTVTALDAGRRLTTGTDAASGVLEQVHMRYSKAVRQGRLDGASGPDGSVQRDKAAGLLLLDGMCFLDTVPCERLWNCWPMVLAYSFASKAWGQAMVEGLSTISWEDKAWDALVLPSERKDLLLSVVKHQRQVGSIDVIRGKGEGTTFLLYGPPGTGKTLTAEAMAEMLHKPLYVVSAGEMGTTPDKLEDNFSQALRLCARWNCICLVDEADTFLQQRQGSDVLRNALVCVMLRLLEYHPGVLFLTTNEARGIDIAVQSRLTLAVRYDPLDFGARKKVWGNIMCGVADGGGSFDVDFLARAPLNGRQIKNCVRLSLALAMERGQELSQLLLATTVDTVCSFQEDLLAQGQTPTGDSAKEPTKIRRTRSTRDSACMPCFPW